MKAIAISCIVLLAGCCPPAKIIKEPVEVKVPVPVPCQATLPTKPQWALLDPSLKSAGLFVKGNASLKELEQRAQYERELEAALIACIAAIPEPRK